MCGLFKEHCKNYYENVDKKDVIDDTKFWKSKIYLSNKSVKSDKIVKKRQNPS